MKKLFFLFLLIFLCQPVYAKDNALDFGNDLIKYKIKQTQKNESMADWLKHADINIKLNSEYKPKYKLGVIYPIVENHKYVIFSQSHIKNEHNKVINLGIGYRKLYNDNKELIGFNVFNDMVDGKQIRSSLGIEYFFWRSEFTMNFYESSEKMNNGYDYKIKTQIPYMPWFNISYEGFNWETKQERNIKTTILIYPKLTLDIGKKYISNERDNKYFKFTYNFLYEQPHAMFKDNRPIIREYKYLNADVSKKKLNWVNRENNLKINK